MPVYQKPISAEKKKNHLEDRWGPPWFVTTNSVTLVTTWSRASASVFSRCFLSDLYIKSFLSSKPFPFSSLKGWDFTFSEETEALNLDLPQLPSEIHLHLRFAHFLPFRFARSAPYHFPLLRSPTWPCMISPIYIFNLPLFRPLKLILLRYNLHVIKMDPF